MRFFKLCSGTWIGIDQIMEIPGKTSREDLASPVATVNVRMSSGYIKAITAEDAYRLRLVIERCSARR